MHKITIISTYESSWFVRMQNASSTNHNMFCDARIGPEQVLASLSSEWVHLDLIDALLWLNVIDTINLILSLYSLENVMGTFDLILFMQMTGSDSCVFTCCRKLFWAT